MAEFTVTIDGAVIPKLEAIMRERGHGDPEGEDDNPIQDFFDHMAEAEEKAANSIMLDEAIAAEEEKDTPDDALLGSLGRAKRALTRPDRA